MATNTKFTFDKSFMKLFSTMNDALDNMIDEIRKFKVSDHEYGVCNTSYKFRFITPQNVSHYIDMLATAFANKFVETPGDIERFSVETAKRILSENGCDAFTPAAPLSYTEKPMTYVTLSDILADINMDCFNKSCYSQFDMCQRQTEVLKDLEKLSSFKMYTGMKNLVNGIPTVMQASNVINSLKDDVCDIIRESIEEFILFAFSVNIVTVNQMKEYLIPSQTYLTKNDDTHDTIVTECCILKTISTDLKLNLPFSINIRNIALSDNSKGFADVKNAVKYITTNPASPVFELLNRFTTEETREEMSKESSKVYSIIDRIFKYNYKTTSQCPEMIKQEVLNAPNPNVQWLDKIANGNQYIDASYRRDKPFTGNVTQSPLTNSLDMLYKVFNGCGCDLTTSEELSLNIIKVSQAICMTAEKYEDVDELNIVRDVLALLGEILTRDIIMLINNETTVIDYSSMNVPNAGTPGYMYAESFLEAFNEYEESYYMEADENTNSGNTNSAPTPNEAAKKKVTVSYTNKNDETKKISARFAKFLNWCRRVLSTIFKKFNKDHKNEIDHVNNHKERDAKIKEALDNGSFKINVNNFPMYEVKLDTAIPKITEHVNKWLVEKDFNAKEFEAGLYPGTEEQQKSIANAANTKAKMETVTNVLLHGQVTAVQPYSGQVDGKMWESIIKDILDTPKLVETYSTRLSEDLNNANTIINQAASKQLPENVENQNTEDAIKHNNAVAMQKIMTDLSDVLATRTVNAIIKDFYPVIYNTYCDIVKAYKRMHKDDEKTTKQTNDNANQNDNKEGSET